MGLLEKIESFQFQIPEEMVKPFYSELAASTAFSIRILCIFAGVLYPVFGWLDYIMFPEMFIILIIIRALIIPLVVIILLVSFLIPDITSNKKRADILAIILFQILGLGITAMVFYTGGMTSPYYAGIFLILLAQLVTIPWSLKLVMINTGLLILFYNLFAMFATLQTEFVASEVWPIHINNNYFLFSSGLIGGIWSVIGFNLRKQSFFNANLVKKEKARSEQLLKNILPDQIIAELKLHDKVEPKKHKFVSVIFTDFANFTKISENMEPEAVLQELEKAFAFFDNTCGKYGLEKIKTIGDSYMCAAGIPTETNHNHIVSALAAMEMRMYANMINKIKQSIGEETWNIRLGVHSGPLVAGVIGQSKFAYDIWGDTVNTASRIEENGLPGEVSLSKSFAFSINPYFITEYRRKVNIKGKGWVPTYALRRIRPDYSEDSTGQIPNERLLSLCKNSA